MTKKSIRSTLVCATILMSSTAVPAYAQAAMDAGVAPPQADADSTDNSAIVVTATRRSTSIQDVPININAVGSEQLARQRIDDIRDIADFTPGITIADTGPGSTGTVVLRGLNASDTDTTGANNDTALGVYLGEVPLYYDFKMLDIARVETLLGPQGTLYGLGTLAGAIRNIPNRPNVSDYELELHGRVYGKDEASKVGYQLDGVLNVPLVKDRIAFRSVTGYYYDPGFIDYPLLVQTPGISEAQPAGSGPISSAFYDANLFRRKDLNFERTFTSRNQLLFQVLDDLSVNFTYAFQRTRTEGGQYNSDGVLGTGRYESAARFAEPVTRSANLASMEINANVGGIFDLVATTGYTEVRNRRRGDNTDLLLDLDYDYETFPAFTSFNETISKRKQLNQEIRLVSSHGGPFSWVLGGFFNEQKFQSDYTEYVPGFPGVDLTINPNEVEYASYVTSKVTEQAIFGEGTFKITPQWQVTAGGRLFNYQSRIQGALVVPLIGDPVSPYDQPPAGGTAKKGGGVWKFNSSFKITPDFMVYATYSKGYRIGGPNSVAPCPNPLPNDPDGDNVNNTQLPCGLPNEVQFGPDTTKNAEIGIRATGFDNKLTFNFNVFQIKWDGIQVASATLNGIVGITVNGGKAKSEGFEASFQLRPVRNFSIQGMYSFTNARLTQDVPANIPVNDPPGTYPSRPIKLDALAGDRLPGSTRNSASLGATYTAPVGNGELIADWTATYRGDVVTRLGWERAFGDKLPGFVLHRASLAYQTDKYSIALFGNNIFNKYAVAAVANDRSRVGLNDGVVLRYYRQTVVNPRTFGLEMRVRY